MKQLLLSEENLLKENSLGEKRVSVIIPTTGRHKETHDSLYGKGDWDVIVALDRGRNAPKNRNNGASLATGDILCFIDDDLTVDPAWLAKKIDDVGDGKSVFCDPPFILILTRNDWERLGSFEERFKIMGESTEYLYRMRKDGMKVERLDPSVVLHHGVHNQRRQFLMWNLLYIHILYPKEFRGLSLRGRFQIFLCKNPISVIRQFVGFYYWMSILLIRNLKGSTISNLVRSRPGGEISDA